ncbi:MAG TPA: cation transporter [Actinomycetota bacterium]|nr:cation transporter [Actinomycetota bacterium]
MADARIQVPEIHCAHCKHSIETAVSKVPGVEDVTVDIESRSVAVRYDDAVTGTDPIHAAIEEQGYEVPR